MARVNEKHVENHLTAEVDPTKVREVLASFTVSKKENRMTTLQQTPKF